MRFELKRPCDNCPFRKEGGVRHLAPERVAQIAGAMLDSQGATFACHKTTIAVEIDGEEHQGVGQRSQHCAGALIFAEKNGNANQPMRIAERLGLYDAKALMADKKVVALVFDDVRQMMRANAEGDKPRPRRKRK